MLHWRQDNKKLLGKKLLLGLVVACAGILLASSNMGRWLEEEIGLPWLFQFRGAQPAPSEVVLISIDNISSQRLGLPNRPSKWPRSLHADLIHKLTLHGAAVIVFDIIFEEKRNQQDNILFASALHKAGNVILFQSLKKQPVHNSDFDGGNIQTGYIETLSSPLPILRDAALGLGPFPLPKVPAQINHFITFIPELGDHPTMPVVALQAYGLSVYGVLRNLLHDIAPELTTQLPTRKQQLQQPGDIQKLTQTFRQLFLNHPDLAQQLILQLHKRSTKITSSQRELLVALINSYAKPHSLYLNFYGPPQTITTLPYYKVLESADHGDPLALSGKTIFVGFSEQFQPEQKDGFYTVFSQPQSGLDLSGVEIAATSFANLLHDNSLKTTSARTDILIYLSWAILLALLLRTSSGAMMISLAVLLGVAYFLLNYGLFRQTHYWPPIVIPLFLQLPLVLVATLLWNFLDAQRERRNIHHAFSQHLPIKIVDQLAQSQEHIAANSQHAHGIVLASDAQQYTTLSEQMPPDSLRKLMNRYYEILFAPIRKTGGVISDVVGDSALAIWTSNQADPVQGQQACQAALEILNAVDDFNQLNPEHALPTRMGLHFGELVLGHVGAMDHYEYRAVGDTVNTASRIENLNKQLGTRILVSREVLQGVEGFITRELGNFLLLGKSKPLNLYELISSCEHNRNIKPYKDFVTALHTFQQQGWNEAAIAFENFIAEYGDDGPSQYYLNLCQQYLSSPPANWDGVTRIFKK